jgi:hypothetical protein
MRVFNRPGILLNPFIVQHSHNLPHFFTNAIFSGKINSCALRDELGAIAYAFHQVGNVEQGEKLFGALESKYNLAQQEETISKCLKCATSDILRRATIRSRRFFDQRVLGKKCSKVPNQKHSDEMIFGVLATSATIREAEIQLGYGRGAVWARIQRAPNASPLAIFEGAFNRGRPTEQ